jgi:hypothetical protein
LYTTLARFKQSVSISSVSTSIWEYHCLEIVKELDCPIFTLVTASCASIPLSLSLNTPDIDEQVCSTESIAIWIAWIAWAFTVSSYPLKIVFIGAYPVAILPSYAVSSKAIPYFL